MKLFTSPFNPLSSNLIKNPTSTCKTPTETDHRQRNFTIRVLHTQNQMQRLIWVPYNAPKSYTHPTTPGPKTNVWAQTCQEAFNKVGHIRST